MEYIIILAVIAVVVYLVFIKKPAAHTLPAEAPYKTESPHTVEAPVVAPVVELVPEVVPEVIVEVVKVDVEPLAAVKKPAKTRTPKLTVAPATKKAAKPVKVAAIKPAKGVAVKPAKPKKSKK